MNDFETNAKRALYPIILLFALIVIAILFTPASMAWGEGEDESVSNASDEAQESSIPEDFLGPILLSTDIRQGEESLVPTEGWNLEGACEWKLESGTLTIRPCASVDMGEIDFQSDALPKTDVDVLVLDGRVKVLKDPYSIRRNNYFSGYKRLQSIEGLRNLDLTEETSLGRMFADCPVLESVDLAGLDTSHITSMEGMFANCVKLRIVNPSSMQTAQVNEMKSMFSGCYSLESIDLSGLDTSRVQDMSEMFKGCKGLKSLDLSAFDTRALSSMRGMFEDCTGLFTVNLAGFDTAAVSNMTSLFRGCTNLASIDLSSFDTTYVTDMEWMFEGCMSLREVDLRSFDTQKVQLASFMFYESGIKKIIVSDTFTVQTYFPEGTWRNTKGDVFENHSSIPSGVADIYTEVSYTPSEDVIPVESIELNQASASIMGKGSVQLSATVKPEDATDKTVHWASSDGRVATVSKDGLVTAQGKGSATITASSWDGKRSAACQVTVTNPVTGLTFGATPMQVKIGKTAKYTVSGTGMLPGAVDGMGTVEWRISDPSIATLSGSGTSATLTGISVGKATLTASMMQEGKPLSASADVGVTWPDPESIRLSESSKQVTVGDAPFALSATILPEAAAETKIIWSSSNANIASVGPDGLVEIHRAGKAMITARAGTVSATCSLEVSAKGILSTDDSDVKGSVLMNDSDLVPELDGMQLRIKHSDRLKSATVRDAVQTALPTGSVLLGAYELEFVDPDGNVHAWSDADHVLTVRIPKSDDGPDAPDGYGHVVCYVNEAESVAEPKDTWVEDNDIVFETTHFSTYVVAASPQEGKEPEPPVKSDTQTGGLAATGDDRGFVLLLLSGMAASSAGIVAISRRIRKAV